MKLSAHFSVASGLMTAEVRLAGGGPSVRAVVSRFAAGETIPDIATDYGIGMGDVMGALRFHLNTVGRIGADSTERKMRKLLAKEQA